MVNNMELEDMPLPEGNEEKLSKFADSFTTAGSQDSGDVTVDRIFAEAILITQPVAPLEEMGIIERKDVGPNTDKAIFTVTVGDDFTWRDVSIRKAELVTGGSLQAISVSTFTEATPVTKATTVFIHDNENLVNSVSFKTLARKIGVQAKRKKIIDAITEMTTPGNYTDSTSIRNANGFTTFGSVASDDTLTPNDLVSSRDDLKTGVNDPIVPDFCAAHTKQLGQLQNHGDFSPGQTNNSNYKRATFGSDGVLIAFYGMDIIELLEHEYAQITTGSFTSQNGHFVIIGKKELMVGRGENNRKNNIEDFRNPEENGIRRTIRINYDNVLKYPDGTRLLAAVD